MTARVFLALWTLPALAVYAVVHLGQRGYLLTVLPACYLVVGRALVALWQRLQEVRAARRVARRAGGRSLLAGALGAHVAFFTAAGPVDVPSPAAAASWRARAASELRALYRFRLWSHTAAGLREQEAVIGDYVAADPAPVRPARHRARDGARQPALVSLVPPRHVLPARVHDVPSPARASLARAISPRAALSSMAAVAEWRVPLPPATRRLVWVVDEWHPGLPRPAALEARPLPHGRSLYVLRVRRGAVDHAGYRAGPRDGGRAPPLDGMGARSSPAGLDRWDVLLLAAGALAVALFLVAESRIAGAPGLPLDDGWIHLQLARNLATGGGFGINRGEPVAASTAPLWSVVLAGLLVVGVPGLAAAKALGLACWAATGLVTRRLAAAVGLPPGLAWGAGLAVVVLSRLVWGALSGMEVPLAALCVAAGAWAIAAGRPGLGAAGLGLAVLARPEAGLLVGLHALGAGRWQEALRRVRALRRARRSGDRLQPPRRAAGSCRPPPPPRSKAGCSGRSRAWRTPGRWPCARESRSSASGVPCWSAIIRRSRPSWWWASSWIARAASAGWRPR